MPTCSRCKEAKDEAEFARNSASSTGYNTYCKPCMRAYNREYYQANKERLISHVSTWKQANRDRVRASERAGYRRNKARFHANVAARRAKQLQATPIWSDQEAVREYYRAVSALNESFGASTFNVDHIVPLKHPLVCGLHAHTNLRVVTREENYTKNNRYWPDMP